MKTVDRYGWDSYEEHSQNSDKLRCLTCIHRRSPQRGSSSIGTCVADWVDEPRGMKLGSHKDAWCSDHEMITTAPALRPTRRLLQL